MGRKVKNDKKTNGEGSIRYIEATGKYEARFRCINPLTGNAERKSFFSEKKTEALTQGRNWVQKMKEGLYPTAGKMTLIEWIDIWLSDYVKPSVRIKTYEKYKSCLYCYIKPSLGEALLVKINSTQLQMHFNQLLIDGSKKKTPLSSVVVRSTRRYLTQCLEQAVRLGLILKNPCRDTKPAKLETKGINILEPSQIKLLMAILNQDIAIAMDNADKEVDKEKQWEKALVVFWLKTLKMVIVLALGTGMRAGEILGLPWYSVLLDTQSPSVNVLRSLAFSSKAKQFVEPKTKSSRRNIWISPFVVNEIESYKEWQDDFKEQFGDIYKDQGLVFTNSLGNPLDYSKMSKAFRDLRKKIGADNVRFHDLRHTHASLLLMRGVNPKVIQERLGHSTITMTLNTYSHLIPSMQQTAAIATESIFS